MKRNYAITVGIECHVQLKTVSKLFSSSANDARYAEPNTLINHIDIGLPGALPVFNEQALVLATQAAIALHTRPQFFSAFDRKHYFYPDLPMGYQITQYNSPIIIGGKVSIKVNNQTKNIGITRAHLESDAGKSTHPIGHNYSLVDYNRANTPLLEIVSEPDMVSSLEAKAYCKELYLRMRYAGVTEGDLYHGNMRFDVNVSVSQTTKLGTRTETKNLNSFRSVEKAIDYEVKRQIEILEAGGKIVQETRGWNEAKQKTISQRTKENADDYRYMPDPDIPPLIIDDNYIDKIIKEMPYGLDNIRLELNSLAIREDHIELLIEANIDFPQIQLLKLILDLRQQKKNLNNLINWLVNIDIPYLRDNTPNDINRYKLYSQLSDMIDANQLTSTNAKQIIVAAFNDPAICEDIELYAKKHNMLQNSDISEIKLLVSKIIADNPKAANDIANGEMKAIGFLIGETMKISGGQANPSLVKQELIRQINITKA